MYINMINSLIEYLKLLHPVDKSENVSYICSHQHTIERMGASCCFAAKIDYVAYSKGRHDMNLVPLLYVET